MKALIVAAIVLSASTLFASAGTNLYDANNWYGYRSNTTISFASTENSIIISGLDDASYAWGYFSPTILAIGQTLSVSGTITTGTIAKDGILRLGLFNSGNCSQDQMVTHSYKSGIDVSSMANYVEGKSVPATATGGMTGVSADYQKAYSRTNAASGTAFLSTASGAQKTTTTFATPFTQPTANVEYAFSYVVTKTEKGISLAVSFNNETAQTASFETEVSTFDVLGIRSPVTSGGSTIKLSNLSMTTTGTVAPEPAMFGLLAGTLALALAGTRRRRR